MQFSHELNKLLQAASADKEALGDLMEGCLALATRAGLGMNGTACTDARVEKVSLDMLFWLNESLEKCAHEPLPQLVSAAVH